MPYSENNINYDINLIITMELLINEVYLLDIIIRPIYINCYPNNINHNNDV